MMRYLDGEASPDEVVNFERRLKESTELRRELALFRSMKDDFSTLGLRTPEDGSVWDKVSRQLGQPIGWLLMIGGTLVWLVFGTYLYFTSDTSLWEKLATSAVAIGALALLVSIGWESYRAWLVDPYKDVHR
jgi:anti-sigma factor RsiW